MEEDEQRRGEEMGLTVRQRQAVMNELRAKYAHASKKGSRGSWTGSWT